MPTSNRTPISVVVLTRNEEGRIADCLNSVGWAAEILVIDDGSTDRTAEIAQGMGARVLNRRMDIEGRHRNWAHAQAQHPWVLSLDADERVTPELAQEIQQLLAGEPACDIYAIPRRNYIGTRWIRHSGWYPSHQVKLFKPAFFQWEETTVHPRAISNSSKPWGHLQQDIIHFSYRDLTDFVAKQNRHTTHEADKWVQDGRSMPLVKGMWRTIDRFVRTWRMKEGYKDGFIGYFISIQAGFYQFLSYAKYWHLKQQEVVVPRGDESVAEATGGMGRPGFRQQGRSGHFEIQARNENMTPVGSVKPQHPQGPMPETGLPHDRTRGHHASGLRTTSPRGTKLSAVILTKNVAPIIGRCLESVRWMDEVILVDGGSTDGTVEAAWAAGAKVIHQPTADNFGELRNCGTDAAAGDWVLQLDADEVVTPEFRAALEQLPAEPTPHAAYKFRRQNNFLGHWMRFGGWDHQSLHLFHRGSARYEGRVHEKLVVRGRIGEMRVGVHHYPFQSLEQFVDRQNRYTSLEARQLFETHGRLPMKTIWHETTFKPFKTFRKIYLKKQGFREGMAGFLFAGLFAFVHFLKWAKYWEILDAQEAG